MRNEFPNVCYRLSVAFLKALRDIDGTRYQQRSLHRISIEQADGICRWNGNRMIVNLPPRHLKSLLGSVFLAAWILGHNPTTKIMILAYSDKLAEKIARFIRSIMLAKWYRRSFQIELRRAMPRR